ncbi:hypothetical protein WUBG_14819, partial [Wuchereria bancrofti]
MTALQGTVPLSGTKNRRRGNLSSPLIKVIFPYRSAAPIHPSIYTILLNQVSIDFIWISRSV